MASLLPLLPLDYFQDQFYSRSGVCLALPLISQRLPGWEYCVAMFIGVNMMAFLIILFCYIYMYKTIWVSAREMKKMVAKQARETKVGVCGTSSKDSDFILLFFLFILPA